MSTLPDLQMDVDGEYSGNAYPQQEPYRVLARKNEEGYRIVVEDSGGNAVGTDTLTGEQAADLIDVASRDHSLSGFDDDWDLPRGIERRIEWVLQTDMDHLVMLNTDQIDEVAMWLRYATGQEVWDGGDEWEF